MPLRWRASTCMVEPWWPVPGWARACWFVSPVLPLLQPSAQDKLPRPPASCMAQFWSLEAWEHWAQWWRNGLPAWAAASSGCWAAPAAQVGGSGWLRVCLRVRACRRHACMLHALSSPPSLPSPFYAGGDPLPAALHLSGCTVTCSKGDTAAAEEAAAVLAPAGTAPLRGIMHAGAVLDSKVIANISAASIRAEFAGRQLETPTPTLCISP